MRAAARVGDFQFMGCAARELDGDARWYFLGIGARLNPGIEYATCAVGERAYFGVFQRHVVIFTAQRGLRATYVPEAQRHRQTEGDAQLRALQIGRIELRQSSLHHLRYAHLACKHLRGRELVFKAQRQARVDGGLQAPGARMDLGADFHHSETTAQVAGDFFGLGVAGESLEESRFAFEYVARTPDARLREQCGHHAGLRAASAV